MDSLLLGTDALSMLAKGGFPVLKTLLAKDEENAARVASEMGFPVTLKISSPDTIHKTEIDGVRLSLKSETEVRQAAKELIDGFTSSHPEKRLDGILVQESADGLEVITGVLKDIQFGPVLMFGLGGVFVEAMRDVSFRLIPIEAYDARDMMEELKNYRVLAKPRGRTIDLIMVEKFLCRISSFITDHPEIEEMDLNPVFISSRGARICDARIRIDKDHGK